MLARVQQLPRAGTSTSSIGQRATASPGRAFPFARPLRRGNSCTCSGGCGKRVSLGPLNVHEGGEGRAPRDDPVAETAKVSVERPHLCRGRNGGSAHAPVAEIALVPLGCGHVFRAGGGR
ncbi:unnamed protein product [Ectocarpus sp. CCAP 1310/34]|nr:unnamed protein product [Ectocarpus sp. CCAP 1310/34]